MSAGLRRAAPPRVVARPAARFVARPQRECLRPQHRCPGQPASPQDRARPQGAHPDQDRPQRWLHSGRECRHGAGMMVLSKLNSIAARIAAAIIVAIVLALAVLIGVSAIVDYYRYERAGGDGVARTRVIVTRSNFALINPRRNPTMLSGRIAVVIRSVAAAPPSEQLRVVSAIVDGEMQIVLDAPSHSGGGGPLDEYTDRLRQLVQMQLDSASPPIPVSARTLAAAGSGAYSGRAELEAALPGGRRLTFTVSYDHLVSSGGLLWFLVLLVIIATLVSIWTARRIAAPIRQFAAAADRLGLDLTAPPLAVRGPREL